MAWQRELSAQEERPTLDSICPIMNDIYKEKWSTSFDWEKSTMISCWLWRQMHPSWLCSLDSKRRSVVSPGTRSVAPCADELDEDRRATCRLAAMRLAYLSHDRTEFAFATKDIARSMRTSDETSWMASERMCRFCMGTLRVVWRYEKKTPLSFWTCEQTVIV